MQNLEKLTSFANRIIRSIVRYPTMKEDTSIAAAVSSGKAPIEPSKTIAPRTAGTLMMKDIIRASSCLMPRMRRTVKVVPDLDTPGSIENPWTRPRTAMSRRVISFVPLEAVPLNLRSRPVKTKRSPISTVDCLPPVKLSLKSR